MVAAFTVELNDTFLCFGMDDREMSSREGSTSRAMVLVSKDFAESKRLNAIEGSDGSENRSNAPSRGSEDEDNVLAVSFERIDVQADESSNLERGVRLEYSRVFHRSSQKNDLVVAAKVFLACRGGGGYVSLRRRMAQ